MCVWSETFVVETNRAHVFKTYPVSNMDLSYLHIDQILKKMHRHFLWVCILAPGTYLRQGWVSTCFPGVLLDMESYDEQKDMTQ